MRERPAGCGPRPALPPSRSYAAKTDAGCSAGSWLVHPCYGSGFGRQPTAGEQSRLHGQVVLVRKIARLLAADHPGHVRRVGHVTLELVEADLLVALAVPI